MGRRKKRGRNYSKAQTAPKTKEKKVEVKPSMPTYVNVHFPDWIFQYVLVPFGLLIGGGAMAFSVAGKRFWSIWLGYIAVVIFGFILAAALHNHYVTNASEDNISPLFDVGLHTSFYNKGNAGPIWRIYNRNIVSHVDLLLHMTISNLQSIESTIGGMGVELFCPNNERLKLTRVPTLGSALYWGWGVDGLKKAFPIDLGSEDLERSIFNRPLRPGEEVRGWLVFNIPNKPRNLDVKKCELHISITDTKRNLSKIVNLFPGSYDEPIEGISSAGIIFRADQRQDISGYQIRLGTLK